MLVNTPKFVVLFLLILPYFVTPEEDYVYNYGSDNFKHKIEEMDGNFIMFYAPWYVFIFMYLLGIFLVNLYIYVDNLAIYYRCRHCTAFRPIWLELAVLVNTQESKFAIAQVDCTVHSKLCQDNDITGTWEHYIETFPKKKIPREAYILAF